MFVGSEPDAKSRRSKPAFQKSIAAYGSGQTAQGFGAILICNLK
jgi:hypothetical protein